MSRGIFPIGSTLYYGDDLVANTPSYTAVANVVVMGLPLGLDVGEVEDTHHGNSSTMTRSYVPTLADRGTIDFEIEYNWSEASHIFLIDPSNARTLRAWKVDLPIQTAGNTTKEAYEWDGFIRTLQPPRSSSREEILVFTGTIRVASAVTRTAEAA